MKWSIVFFALLLSEAVNAQAPTGLYMPLPNCKVKKQQVSIPEELITGQDAVWDFRDLTMSERIFIVKYSEWNDSIIAGTERGTSGPQGSKTAETEDKRTDISQHSQIQEALTSPEE